MVPQQATCDRGSSRRSNLTIVSNAMAHRVLFRNRTALGVAFESAGRSVEAIAKREVILSCGAIRTPALLERSGVEEAVEKDWAYRWSPIG